MSTRRGLSLPMAHLVSTAATITTSTSSSLVMSDGAGPFRKLEAAVRPPAQAPQQGAPERGFI